VLRIAALVLALACFACATSNEPAVSREETQIRTFRARVAAVDQQTRVVTLVYGAGDKATFRADEAVRNLPQVAVGDELVGEVMESLAVEVRPATAEEQAAPESIDKPAGGGTLRDALGNSHFVKVRDPAVLDRVKVGDTVVVTLTEALRIEVVAP